MLQIKIPSMELFDEATEQFLYVSEQTLQLEHSLVSLSKWESKWCKPFLGKESKTYEETLDYIKCMTLNPDVPPEVYYCISDAQIGEINRYIESPMTATTISEKGGKKNREIITSEIIYYWMVALHIPVEFETWHLNRLITLIKVVSIKSQPPKKKSQRQLMEENRAINEANKRKFKTTG